jgi:uncharacterized protein YqgC (DUF456 family)
MYERAKNYTLMRPRLRKTVGWALVFVGILALVLPVIPGILLLVIAFELLGFRLLFLNRILKKEEVVVSVRE